MSDNFGFGCACGCWANALATRPTLNAIATADALVRDNVILRMVDYSLRRRAGTRPPGRWKNDCWMRIGRPLHAMVLRMRSEEHTSELQSLMRTSYAVFCLKK